MKIETSELIGPQLDWAVATAAGMPIVIGWSKLRRVPLLDAGKTYTVICPSTNPDQANRIIEREGIRLYPDDAVSPKAIIVPNVSEPHFWYRQYGETIYIAAMRCFVANRLGDEVDVPEELANAHTEPKDRDEALKRLDVLELSLEGDKTDDGTRADILDEIARIEDQFGLNQSERGY